MKYVVRNCFTCDVKFKTHQYKAKNLNNKYVFCNKKCYTLYQITKIDIACSHCGKIYIIVPNKLARTVTGNHFCSKECVNLFPKGKLVNKTREKFGNLKTKCGECKKKITVIDWKHRKSKSGFSFCNNSCGSIYFHKNSKKSGSRRSKLELYIEEQLNGKYSLVIDYNKNTAIKCELDIYISKLKLAFEINGIYHFKAIHGEEKLRKTQLMDKKKISNCLKENIELHVIDISKQRDFTIKRSQVFLERIINIIDTRLQNPLAKVIS